MKAELSGYGIESAGVFDAMAQTLRDAGWLVEVGPIKNYPKEWIKGGVRSVDDTVVLEVTAHLVPPIGVPRRTKKL